jgi:hypothetical protein
MTKWRGQHVDHAIFDRKADTYLLVSGDGQIITELKRHEFLANPQLRALEHRSGKHRGPRSTFRGSAAGQSYFTIAQGAIFSWAAGGVTWIGTDFAKQVPIEDAGIRAGEVIARRCWRIIDGRLYSTYRRDQEWIPRQPMTGDVRREYGVHAFKDDAFVREYIEESRMWDNMYIRIIDDSWVTPKTPFAIGTIALWGEIVEHERGYRAEFGKIASIDRITGSDDPAMLGRLRAEYGVAP